MGTLQDQITQLSEEFTEGLLAVIREQSIAVLISEDLGPTTRVKSKSGAPTERLARRSDEDIQKTVKLVVAAVKKAGAEGIRTEFLREKLGIDKRELSKPLAVALKQRLLRKKGAKRATTFFAK